MGECIGVLAMACKRIEHKKNIAQRFFPAFFGMFSALLTRVPQQPAHMNASWKMGRQKQQHWGASACDCFSLASITATLALISSFRAGWASILAASAIKACSAASLVEFGSDCCCPNATS